MVQSFLIGVNSKYIHTALGVRYITEYCRVRRLSVHLIEATVNEPVLSVLTRITEQIEAVTYDYKNLIVIGLEVHIWNRRYVLELGELLRKVLPDALILLGGPEVMFHPEKTLSAAPFADFIVCGEGEEPVAVFLQNIVQWEKEACKYNGMSCEKEAFSGRRNIDEWVKIIPKALAYRGKAGQVVKPDQPFLLQELDQLPFPYPDLEKVVAEHKIVYYEASRGCPFHCSYCLSGISHFVRRRSLPLVLADMARFIQAGVKLVKFVDRTYNLEESYYLPIMRYLASAETNATFHFEIKADILSREVIEFLMTVPQGRFQLEIGVQSTNPEVLRAIGRQDNWENLKRNVAMLRHAGNMHIHMDLIAGLPLEDMESFAHSFNDVYGLHPHALQLGFLKVLPGTVMEQTAQEHKLVYMDQPPYEILSTKYVSYRKMRFLKIFEEVFDLTSNSGRFSFTLEHLIREIGKGSAFSLFAKLTDWYRKHFMVGLGHTGIDTARMLFDFVSEEYPELLFETREVLRLDVLLRLPNFKPAWLNWRTEINYDMATAFWRKEEIVRKYISGYSFENWRSLHKKYVLEELLYNPWTGERNSVFILINYENLHLTRIKTSAIITKSSKDGGTLRTE